MRVRSGLSFVLKIVPWNCRSDPELIRCTSCSIPTGDSGRRIFTCLSSNIMDHTTASREVIVGLEEGLHMTPLTTLTLLASKYSSHISIYKDDLAVDAKSMLDLLSLMAECGTRLVLKADGTDAQEAVNAIGQLFDNNFRPV